MPRYVRHTLASLMHCSCHINADSSPVAGHGYDLVNAQCAEFCVTSHHFSVNGGEHSVEYKEAGAATDLTNARLNLLPNLIHKKTQPLDSELACLPVLCHSPNVFRAYSLLTLAGTQWGADKLLEELRIVTSCFRFSSGTQWGCADKVREGSVPNEHGTWMFGRMGWCDGQEVRNPQLCEVGSVCSASCQRIVPASGGGTWHRVGLPCLKGLGRASNRPCCIVSIVCGDQVRCVCRCGPGWSTSQTTSTCPAAAPIMAAATRRTASATAACSRAETRSRATRRATS